MIGLAILIASVLLSAIVGLFVYVRNPRKMLNVVFALLALSITILSVSNYFSLSDSPYTLLNIRIVIIMTTIAVTALYFLTSFMLTNTSSLITSRYGKALIIISLLIAGLDATPYVFTGIGTNNVPVAAPSALFFILHFIVFLMLSLKNLFVGVKNKKGAERSQFTIILIGVLPIILFAPFTSFILPVVFSETSLIILSPLYTTFFVMAIAYAIVKHRLFDVKLAAVRTVTYIATLVTLAAIYYVSLYAVSSLFSGEIATTTNPMTILPALFSALIFQPVKLLFDNITDRIFYRSDYNPSVVLNDLGGIVAGNIRLQPLLAKSIELFNNSIKPSSVSFVLVDSHGEIVKTEPLKAVEKLDKTVLLKIIEANHSLLVADLLGDKEEELLLMMRRSNISIRAQLTTSNGLGGCIIFSEKRSGLAYTKKDLDLIGVMADELSIAIENSLRYEEIKAFNTTLQGKVDEATLELQHSNKKLKALDESKDEFISMASHQLRTPLTSVKGYLSMVLEGDVGKITPEQRKVLEEAYTSSQRMVYLIGDFLNVSRLQTGKFELEKSKVHLPVIIADEIDQLRASAKARNTTLDYEAPEQFPVLSIDETKIRQVMMNFIDNAIYYSRPGGGKITVTLAKHAKHISFKVIDNGIGVPRGEQHQLFSKFYRASNAKKARPDGTGIGLFMAKKVIVAHGGAIIFESKEGEGSIFGFRLPIDPTESSEKAQK